MQFVYLATGWAFGVLFGFVGLVSLLTGDVLPSIPLIAIALLLLPPSRSRVHAKTGIIIPAKVRAITSLILIGVFGYLSANSEVENARAVQEEQARADAKAAAEKQEALLADFTANKAAILGNARKFHASGDFQKVVALGRKYSFVKDTELQQLANDAKSVIDRKNAAEETQKIVSELKSVRKGDIDQLATSYTKLSKLNPDNQEYIEKARTYSKMLNEKKEAERVAAEKQRQAEIVAKERRARIEAQFSPWDGSHRNLERVVKESMKNPDSYDHVKTVYVDKGNYLIVQTTFRGTNSFGGVVPNTVTAKVSLNGDVLQILSK